MEGNLKNLQLKEEKLPSKMDVTYFEIIFVI